jgi:hypothetical protein
MLTMHLPIHRLVLASAMAASVTMAHDATAEQVNRTAAANVVSTSPDYSEPMERLKQSTQKLREAIQAMAKEPAGERRNRAIEEANDALFETHRAMVALPPELRVGSTGPVDYSKSMERLKESAELLREATQAMAQQPAGEERTRAIDQARQALFDIRQAMIALPPDMRVAGESSEAGS